ncbi:hypothetical protein ACGC1H_002208 [Rhizoctonia solani]|uniref:BAG domain-containing protein n=1 Tax=Rhizoctonia solani TaxID=456999 RepID=A0A8H2X6Z7_9AGAM|nr:unnamed protein product [Rhizoctonia solani]
MFTLAQPAYHFYNPYEELAMQQELQRRRQIEAYLRRQREAEEMERRRREYEAAVRVEYEQRREAELERRRQAELQRRRQAQQARGRHSMYDGGLESLFEALYGSQRQSWEDHQTSTPANATARNPSPTPATVSTPAPEPTPAEPKSTPEPKVEEPQPDTAPSHSAVQSVLSSFATLQSDFTFPARLDFVSGSSKLAYTPNNAPLHGYEHALTGLLTRLDAVESYGDDGVRRARKEAVKAIEKELERLDGMKAEAWRRINEPEPEPEPEVSESVVPSTETEVDPASIPLPDEDEEMEASGTTGSEISESFTTNQSSVLEEPLVPADSKQSEPATSSGTEHSTSLEQSTDTNPAPASTLSILDTGITVSDDAALVIPLPCTPTTETAVQPLASSSPSVVSHSDPKSGLELEEYVDVETMSTPEHKDTSLEEVGNDGDLELMRDWDLDF